jgi:uncharacterized protein YegL
MQSDVDKLEIALVDNTSQRLPCVLALDASGSMAGGPIDALNAGLRLLEEELKGDDLASQRVQLLVIRFSGNTAEILCDWTDAMAFTAPRLDASGLTPMGGAVRLAIEKIEEQKNRYRQHGIAYFRPWLFLLTDGEPNDNGWEQVAAECRAAEQANKLTTFCIGTGPGANMGKLSQFSNRTPVQLSGLKFRELFLWLSQSARTASKSAQASTVQLAAPSDWMQVPS